MNEDEEMNARPVVRSRGRMMDFAPRNAAGAPRPVRRTEANLSDNEQRRREIARREVARREEIHRQIERQKEEDIIAERRAIAARRDLARRLEVEREENKEALIAHEKELELRREREEKAKRRAMIEARAMRERQRILAERRAKRARMELAARREAENKLRTPVHEFKNPEGSKDPIARKIRLMEPEPEEFEEEEKPEPKKIGNLFRRKKVEEKENKVEKRLGSVEDFEKDLDELENSSEHEDNREDNIEEFINDEKDEEFFDDIDEMERSVRDAEEAPKRERFTLGGRSPFINTAVEKRPLSGGNKTFESTAAAASMTRRAPAPTKPMKPAKAPKARGRFVPYEEPIPHKNIYARTVAKEKENRDVPSVMLDEAPKGSKLTLIIAIILTVILGAVVGAIAYLALFQ